MAHSKNAKGGEGARRVKSHLQQHRYSQKVHVTGIKLYFNMHDDDANGHIIKLLLS